MLTSSKSRGEAPAQGFCCGSPPSTAEFDRSESACDFSAETDAPRILIVGCGVIGGLVLDNLVRSGRTIELILGGRDADTVTRKVNSAVCSGLNLRLRPIVRPAIFDLLDTNQTVNEIAAVAPNIIFNATSILPWWKLHSLPAEVRTQVDKAGGGAWSPTDMLLPLKLMRAVALLPTRPKVVNASYADVVNPALSRVGIGPETGIGNVANVIPALRLSAAQCLQAHLLDVQVKMVAHHYVSYSLSSLGHTGGAPYAIEISLAGEVVTSSVPVQTLFGYVASDFRRVRGVQGQSVTASSATDVLLSLLSPTPRLCHAPGVHGRIGGYPVLISKQEITITPPAGYSLMDCEEINASGQKFDGIEHIDSAGSIHFTAKCQQIMRKIFGFNCSTLSISDCEEVAAELQARYYEVANAKRSDDS